MADNVEVKSLLEVLTELMNWDYLPRRNDFTRCSAEENQDKFQKAIKRIFEERRSKTQKHAPAHLFRCGNQNLTLESMSSQANAYFLKCCFWGFLTECNISKTNLQFWVRNARLFPKTKILLTIFLNDLKFRL